ncbi:hypothetical protein IMSHALPRED_002885 [Imshaugia aleurites]|uniref:Heterokaryon incompatibility domain-containing protein n=1 Tax=Imshaugia aleurites TaxID=172621 RepID=A0A8H3PJE8_9LECA|nr:hypothetical protein IMSHALPRED_002885 [Imshaugia aleurites]
MNVKERAKVFEQQPISPLASKSTLAQRSEHLSPSHLPSLYISEDTRGGVNPLSSYNNGQAVKIVQLGADALENLSFAQLEDIPPLLPRRPSSPGRQGDGELIVLDADECSESSASKDAAHLLPPPLPRRIQSSDAKLPSSDGKRPLPVPNKSEALLHKFKALSLVKEPYRTIPGLLRSNTTNNPVSNGDDRTPIIMIDNDADQNEDVSAAKDLICDRETHSELTNGTKDAQDNSEQQAVVSKNFFDDVQKLIKRPPPKPPKPDANTWKISQTMDSLLVDAKNNLDQVAQITKPVVAGAGRGLEWTRVGAKNALDNSAVTKVFLKTKDDLADAAAKVTGTDGQCSKCQELSNDLDQIHPKSDGSKKNFEWATPLSRIIYHANWCRICRLLLKMLCEPANDPLLHPGVAPYVQPEIKGATMKKWTEAGWEYTDSHWPFGHGEKRHDGATYVLGPGGQAIKVILTRTLPVIMTYGSLAANPNQRTQRSLQQAKDRARTATHRQQLADARARNRHPLSCVIKITTNAPGESDSPGLMTVELLGYGRKLGAGLQVLSQFRLRAVSSASINEPDDPNSLQLERSLGPFSYGRLLDAKWIDPSIGRLWLRECESRHGRECNEHGWAITMEKPKFLRVVDVQDYCIKSVTDSTNLRYIALSYVWGRAKMIKLLYSNMESLMRKNGLLEVVHALPQTITDAIEVVKGMGERYLWTDALCILQENTKEALEQISYMDRVYSGAICTIVAAQGATANSGIEGIRQHYVPQVGQPASQQRNLQQNQVGLKGDMSLIAPLAAQDHKLDDSVWNIRAWTFQERLLSRRLIVFTHGQMIFHCRRMICREDMSVADSGVPYQPLQWLSLKPQHMGVDTGSKWIDGSTEITRHGATRLVRSAVFAEYTKAIEEYTHREISYQSDVLNAFAGLLHIFSRFFRCKTLLGLPESLLDIALLWKPTRQLKRRREFPSWSWAGWVGRVTYDEPFTLTRRMDGTFVAYANDAYGQEGVRPLVRWHVRDANSRRVVPLNASGLGFPFQGATLPNEWEKGPCYFDSKGNRGPLPVSPVPNNGPWSRLNESESRHLIFWTSSSVKFRFGEPIHQKSDQRRTVHGQPPPLRYRLIDAESQNVGTVLLDGADQHLLDVGRHEFIQIAEAQYFGLDDEPRDVQDCPLYLVMLVFWDEGFETAYRLGLGRVRKASWVRAKPMLKLVCLA